MSSDVLNILIDEIVSPVIEQSKEIGISLKNCTISLGTVNKDLKITKNIQGVFMLNLFLLKAF